MPVGTVPGGVLSGVLFSEVVWLVLAMLIAVPMMGAGVFGYRTRFLRLPVLSLGLHIGFAAPLGLIYIPQGLTPCRRGRMIGPGRGASRPRQGCFPPVAPARGRGVGGARGGRAAPARGRAQCPVVPNGRPLVGAMESPPPAGGGSHLMLTLNCATPAWPKSGLGRMRTNTWYSPLPGNLTLLP